MPGFGFSFEFGNVLVTGEDPVPGAALRTPSGGYVLTPTGGHILVP